VQHFERLALQGLHVVQDRLQHGGVGEKKILGRDGAAPVSV